MERCSEVRNSFCIPEAEIDKPGQVIGLPSDKVIVNHFQGTHKQGATCFPFSQSFSLYRPGLLTISEALPKVIFIILANLSKNLQMLDAVYVLLNCAIEYAHLEL